MKLVLIPKDNAPDLYEVDDAVKKRFDVPSGEHV